MNALKFALFVGIITIIISFTAMWLPATEPMPLYNHHRYYPEMWRGDILEPTYPEEFQPDTGLYAMTSTGYSEPGSGYPMHSGVIWGVSDTITVYVELFNRNQNNYNISSYQPDNWFEPVVYDVQMDPKYTSPLLLPEGFGYAFQYWKDQFGEIVGPPSEIPATMRDSLLYTLVSCQVNNVG